jgi:deoxyribodipyrimidine photo-lyase
MKKKSSVYKETRNGMVGEDYSSKFCWLALGCISPRTIYDQVKKYEEMYEANDSTYWLVLNCCGAIFFRFMFKKYQTKFSCILGLNQINPFKILE